MHDNEFPQQGKPTAEPGHHPELSAQPPFDFHIVLIEPEIPPNTGNAGRLCVATQSTLHIVGTPAFSLDDKAVRRAGLDYWKYVKLHRHADFESWLHWWRNHTIDAPFFLMETGPSAQPFFKQPIPPKAAFVFGKETVGLRKDVLAQHSQRVFEVPMFSSRIRSLNLANTVALVLYEGIRQNHSTPTSAS